MFFNKKYRMKYILMIALIFPLCTQAQDCNLKKEKDDFTNKPKLSTGFMEIQDFTLSIDADSKNIDFFFVSKNSGAKCFDENSTAFFTFEGGKLKSEFKNGGGMNCDGAFHMIFRNTSFTPSALTRIATKKTLSIKFTDSNGKPTLIELTPDQQVQLMKNASCIAAEAKTVL